MEGKELIKKVKQMNLTDSLNSIGKNDNWHINIYAIYNTFTEDEIKKMSRREISLLIRLADKISEALY